MSDEDIAIFLHAKSIAEDSNTVETVSNLALTLV